MPLRATTNSNYQRVLAGLNFNLSRLVNRQAQISTGRRILAPSDDPGGTARVLSLDRQLAGTDRFLSAIGFGRTAVDAAAAALEVGSSTLAEAREKLVQGMNGSLSQEDRNTLANEIELIRDALLEVGNTRAAGRTVFGGTASAQSAFESRLIGGRQRVVYVGNDEGQRVLVGNGVDLAVTTPGSDLFAKAQSQGTTFSGLTGAASGVTADQGSGYEHLEVRHDATNAGAIGTVGLALAGGGASDTFVGSETLVVDATAGTVRLGSGPARPIPQPGDPDLADFTLENAAGGELHLDFTGFTGAAFTGTVDATASFSIDGSTFVPVNFASQDVRLVHPDSGNVVHVDATGISRAGRDLVTFRGAVNAFDALQGIADELRNPDGLDQAELLGRLDTWLGELDRNHENVLVGLGGLGSRSQRLASTEEALHGVRLQLAGQRSEELDVDFAEAALDMAQAQQALEIAQASGVRLLQTNLLNFLR